MKLKNKTYSITYKELEELLKTETGKDYRLMAVINKGSSVDLEVVEVSLGAGDNRVSEIVDELGTIEKEIKEV